MKKTVASIVATLFLLLAVTAGAFGTADSLQAESGRILAPAGLGADLTTSYQRTTNTGSLIVATKLSYGLSPSITLTGEFDNNNRAGLNLLFSPMHEGMGYTVYAGYDLKAAGISRFGLSMWTDMRWAFAFVNFETGRDGSLFRVTPGASMRLGSKLGISGEIEMGSEEWSLQELRLGASYALNRKVKAKLAYRTGLTGTGGQVITAGVSTEI